MPPKPMPAREIVKRLRRIGFEQVSQKGSHLKLRRTIAGKTYTAVVPMHTRDVAGSVIGRILQQANVERDEFDTAE